MSTVAARHNSSKIYYSQFLFSFIIILFILNDKKCNVITALCSKVCVRKLSGLEKGIKDYIIRRMSEGGLGG